MNKLAVHHGGTLIRSTQNPLHLWSLWTAGLPLPLPRQTIAMLMLALQTVVFTSAKFLLTISVSLA